MARQDARRPRCADRRRAARRSPLDHPSPGKGPGLSAGDCWNATAAAKLLRESGARWFEPEFLPGYAPDLNPVEAVWSRTKHVDLANYAPDDLLDLGDAAGQSFVRQLRDRRLRESYFQTAKLSLS